MKSLTVTIFLLLASLTTKYAQTVKLDELTIEDGLTQGMIHDILQDSLGFMWFATKDGLNRYDGYDFKLYSHFPADSFSLSGHVVNVLFEDSFGRIWVGTHNNGLNVFDRTRARFYKLGYEEQSGRGLNSNRVFSVEQQNDSIFWVGTGRGLCRLVVPEGEALWEGLESAQLSSRIKSYPIEPVPNPNLSSVATCLSTVSDTLYFAISNRLFRLDRNNYQEWEEMSDEVQALSIAIPFGFRSIEMTSDGHLIMPTNQEIKIYHEGKSWDIPLPEKLQGFLPDVTIDKAGTVWGVSAGLYKIHPGRSRDAQLEILFTTKDAYFTPTVYVDRTGVVWLGTNGYGIRKYNPSNTRFNHLLPGTSTRQLYTDLNGRCWVWVSVSLRVLDPDNGNYELPAAFPSWIEKATWVLNPESDIFWFHYPIIEKQTALVKINERTGEVQSYPFTCKPNPNSPLLIDRSGNIWFSSRDGQLVIFQSDTETYHYYSMSGWFDERQENAAITAFHYEAASDVVWAGTQYGLLRLQRTAADSFDHRVYDFDINNPQSISENYVLSICKRPGEANTLWIGTKGGGLNQFDTQTGAFKAITTKEGLPNNVAYGLLPDEEGHLWVTTNRGLSKYHPEKGTFKNYTSADGLQSNEFNTSSYHRARDGRFLIGGVNGVHVFHPKEVQLSSLPPKVYLTGLNINNRPWREAVEDANALKPIERIEHIELRHHQDQLFFQFAALDYAASQNNHYRYQMVGLDDAPVDAGTRREVAYANLTPGQYTFKVWGANNEDIWSAAPAVLKITISPPWWATYWAYLAYLALFFTLFYSAYRFQVNRDRLKTQLAYEQREAERLAALDRMKSNFFSNITHEFRTPLTLILEPARRLGAMLQDKNGQNWAKLIISNSERMLQLVNQLLDINRLEEGLMSVKLQQADLNQLLISILKDYEGAAQDKAIRLELEITGRAHLKWVEIDTEKVSKIVHNLLSNALKFTPDGGEITVSATGMPDHQKVEISVEDTGPGIAPEHHERIFDRFYQVDDSSTRSAGGTGIGLALCNELAQKLGGNIRASSEPGKGSRFTLELPLYFALSGETVADGSSITGETAEPSAPAAAEQEHSILIVEDNKDLRDFLCSILGKEFDLSTAQDGIEGLQMATATQPDIIISDVMMPRLDGYAMTAQLKADIRTSHIPVVMLTAKSALKSRLTGLKTGADAYLSKPFYAEELMAQIHNLLEQRARLQQYFKGESEGAPAPAVPDLEHEFLQKAYAAIEDHLTDEQFSVEQLSNALLLSRSQLHRKLKALTGQTTSEFLRDYRLKKALELLRQPGLSIGEVSHKVGFGSPQYFATKFKERYGYPPSEAHRKA
jgi:signal transduction histidine kinase/DNA-binding response OmpR family regulator/ligand-binding sensor domain-containing protein